MPSAKELQEFEAAWRALKTASPEVAQKKRDELARQRDQIERDIIMLDQIIEAEGHAVVVGSRGTGKTQTLAMSANGTPNKPQGLLLVISEDPTRDWKLSDARDVMVERGWLQPGENGTHQIQNTAWKLKQRRHLASPRNGYYRITPEGMEAIRR